MAEWSAEVEVDEELVRRLLRSQFPALDLDSVRPFAEGWDNAVWVVDERWAFRFPRRAIAIAGVERELAVLPRLAPLLPLPIPAPALRGAPADAYGWPFFGAPLLAGSELSDVPLTEAQRVGLARPLARFLRALHAPATAAAVDTALPADPNARTDMGRRVPRTAEALAEARRLGLWRAPPTVQPLLDAARALPPPRPSALVHGDLHFRHLLVDDAGRLTGVIDWGDLCRADPSVDLSVYWSVLPPAGRREFVGEYGEPAEDQLVRARVLALCLCAILAVYGHRERMAAVEREAIAGLRRAATD
jgi:aminoglycoside phosphotransferase (APT) family kinase protein